MQTTQYVIIGTLFICGRAAHILFDTGATTSFIAFRFVDSFEISWEILGENLSVTTPIWKSLITSRIYKDVN